MGNHIVAGEPLSCNDIPILANLFETSFEYYNTRNTPFFSDYLQRLRTLAGLGFSAALVDRSLFYLYQRSLAGFIAQKEGDFKEKQSSKSLIALSSAEMVRIAARSFRSLRFPRYYDDYYMALYYTIAKIPNLAFQQQIEVERILACLAVK